jgi:hypothetical protein
MKAIDLGKTMRFFMGLPGNRENFNILLAKMGVSLYISNQRYYIYL